MSLARALTPTWHAPALSVVGLRSGSPAQWLGVGGDSSRSVSAPRGLYPPKPRRPDGYVSGASRTSGGLAVLRHPTGAFSTGLGRATVLKQPRDTPGRGCRHCLPLGADVFTLGHYDCGPVTNVRGDWNQHFKVNTAKRGRASRAGTRVPRPRPETGPPRRPADTRPRAVKGSPHSPMGEGALRPPPGNAHRGAGVQDPKGTIPPTPPCLGAAPVSQQHSHRPRSEELSLSPLPNTDELRHLLLRGGRDTLVLTHPARHNPNPGDSHGTRPKPGVCHTKQVQGASERWRSHPA